MKKIALLFAIFAIGLSSVLAQNREITGIVTSADDKSPIPGVSVSIKGTTLGTITDFEGKYILKVPENATTLVFSFVGMKTKEVKITSSKINVFLESDVLGLNEVLVVAYGTTTKASYSGAVSQVNNTEITSGNTQSVDKALMGKVAGIRVSSTTGDPGSSGEMQIRGVGSISASTQPLYVVDGVPMNNGNFGTTSMSADVLSTLNPEDIDNISILKDAAAASLYGSRAANGVVLITTKKGKSGKTSFNFKITDGWSKMGSDSYKIMNGDQFKAYAKESLVGYYLLYYGNALYPTDANFGDATIQSEAEAFAEDNLSEIIDDQGANTNWRDIVYDKGHEQNYQFSASGGNDKTTFFTSLGYTQNKGIVLGSKFERFSGRMNLDHKAFSWLDFGIHQTIANTKQRGYSDQSDQDQGIGYASPLGIMFGQNPMAPRYLSDGSVNTSSSLSSNIPYPDEVLGSDDEFNTNKTFRSTSDGYLKINFLPELSLKSTVGYDWINNQYFTYWSPESTDGESTNGYGYKLDSYQSVLTTSTVANYAKTFDKHNLSAMAGFESEDIKYNYLMAEATNYSTSKLSELSNAQASDVASSKSESTLLSFFGNVNYNFASKYYLGTSIRTDGSSRLGSDNRWATFYSVSGSWRVKEEEFLKENSSIDELKIRSSYGTTGTLPSNYYEHLGLYSFSGGYGEESAINLSQAQNENLSWEKSANFNVGIDMGLLHRFTFTIEYYNKKTNDLLLDEPTSYLTGYPTSMQNVGKISNKGFEFEIHSENIKLSNGFKWSTDINLSTLKTEVTELPDHSDIIAGDGNLYIYSEGHDVYSFYLPKYYGVDPTCGLAQFYINPDAAPTDDNLTYSYGNASRGIVAKAVPDVTGGLSNTFSFKGFDLSILLTYQFGGNLFDYPGYFSHHDGLRLSTFNLAEDVVDNYWTKSGDVVDNPIPIYSNTLRPDKWSTRYIKSTDNIRIRELSLGYSFPKELLSSLYLQNLKLFFKTNNLAFVWRETKGLDPEVPLNGYRTVDTPAAKTFQFGISVDL